MDQQHACIAAHLLSAATYSSTFGLEWLEVDSVNAAAGPLQIGSHGHSIRELAAFQTQGDITRPRVPTVDWGDFCHMTMLGTLSMYRASERELHTTTQASARDAKDPPAQPEGMGAPFGLAM